MSETGPQDESVVPPAETAAYDPPRFWWLKRIGAAILLFTVLLLAVRLAIGIIATRRLEAQVNACRAAGEPIYPADFATPPLPDEENAVVLLEQAEALLAVASASRSDADPLQMKPDVLMQHLDEVRAVVQQNQQSLQLLRAARGRPGTDWRAPLRSPLCMRTYSAEHRRLWGLARAAAILDRASGNDAGAIETIRDILDHADRLELQPAGTLNHLWALSARAKAIEVVQASAPFLPVAAPPRADLLPAGPAAREQVTELVKHLLEESGQRAGLILGIYVDRAEQLDTVICLCNGTLAGSGMTPGTGLQWLNSMDRFASSPTWKVSGARAMQYTSAAARAGLADNYPAARAILPTPIPDATHFALDLYVFATVLSPDFQRRLELDFHCRAQRRMAALALAIRLYELEHGRRPTTLAELAPRYIPAIPPDPFAPQRQPFGYRPDAERPLLYSVSLNGLDENGAHGMRDGRLRWDVADLPFYLDGLADETTTATNSQPASADSADSGNANEGGERP